MTNTLELDAAVLLDAAVVRLNEKGWRQGANGTEDGPNCGDGALVWESRRLWPKDGEPLILSKRAVDTVLRARHQLGYHVGASFVTWNDDAGRTREQVTTAMTEVAAALRAAGGGS